MTQMSQETWQSCVTLIWHSFCSVFITNQMKISRIKHNFIQKHDLIFLREPYGKMWGTFPLRLEQRIGPNLGQRFLSDTSSNLGRSKDSLSKTMLQAIQPLKANGIAINLATHIHRKSVVYTQLYTTEVTPQQVKILRRMKIETLIFHKGSIRTISRTTPNATPR